MRIGKIILWVLLLGALTLFLTPHAYAGNEVVTNCSNDTELRAKLGNMQSSSGGILSFNCGTATIVLTGGVLPTITTATYVDGGNKITLSGNNASRIFFVQGGGALNLYNLTLTKGSAGSGGAIYNMGTLDINTSRFLQNQAATSGGAIFNAGTLHDVGSEFANNKAASGGAIHSYYNNSGATLSASNLHHNEATGTSLTNGFGGTIYLEAAALTILNSTVNDNKGRQGGAIYVNDQSSLTLSSSTVNYNQAIGAPEIAPAGGAILNYGTSTLSYSNISGNSAQNGSGGALDNNYSYALSLTNVTMVNNSAKFGGAISNTKGKGTLTNVTISNNSATFYGGGIQNGTYGGEGLTLKNTIVANSPNGGNCYDMNAKTINSLGFNLSDDDTCTEFFDQGGDLNGAQNDPMLGDLADNGGVTSTILPKKGSPAIDAGTGSGAPTDDQRGIARPQGTAHDIGAAERCLSKPTKPTSVTPRNNKKAKGPKVSLDWNDMNCATKYSVVVRSGSSTGTQVFSKKNLTTSATLTNSLVKGQTYFWQVTANGDAGKTKSEWWGFRVK